MAANNNITAEYIQFSKRVTRWGIGLVTGALIVCLFLIALKEFPQYVISAIQSLYTAYVTIMGITIGAYQGNSSLEKWTKAKYEYQLATKPNIISDSQVIDDIEDTYG